MNLLVRINPDGRYLELYPRIDLSYPENGVRRWVAESDQERDEVVARIEFQEERFIFKKSFFKSPEIQTDDETIEALINQMLEEQREIEIGGTEDDSQEGDGKEPVPYDPKKISIKSVNWSISYINDLIGKYGDMDFSPDFQREFVWDYSRKAKLIESLLLGIPIPAFYIAQNAAGKFQVVDGLQRLTAITEFLNNRFNLKYLEYLKDLDGYWYDEALDEHKAYKNRKYLSREYHRMILGTQINVNIIEASSPVKLKYDVFRRLNTLGKPLNAQEIRNCLAEASTRKLVNELAKSNVFYDATGGSVKTIRMEAQELIMRFICFWYDRILSDERWVYRGNMQGYLDEGNQRLNDDGEKHHLLIRRDFEQAMHNALYLFGPFAFRKCLSEDLKPGARRQLVNKSLFTTWSVLLCGLDPQKVSDKVLKESMANHLAEALENGPAFYEAVSYKTNDALYLNLAFDKTSQMIQQYLLPL